MYTLAIRFLLAVSMVTGISLRLHAQTPLPEVEKALQSLAEEVLNHESFEHKLKQNKAFASLLNQTLLRPESFKYPFDSLKTISILEAEDKAFRIFTWQISDRKNPDLRYGPEVHYYFGMIQRAFKTKNGEIKHLTIPLIEMQEIPPGVENMVLDNTQWLGGLYYPIKYHGNKLPRMKFKYYDPSQRKSNGAIKRVKKDMYLLLGWNGLDNRSNIKFVDVLSFDPRDSTRAIFGANVFYFDPLVAKHRAIFRYSEYSPFGLNMAYVKAGLFPGSKKEMIVYDHLGSPKPGDQKLKEIWEMGADGSYDALSYQKGGRFEWRKNVEVIDQLSRREIREAAENQEKILRARLAELKRLAILSGDEQLVEDIERLEERKDLDKKAARFLRRKEKMVLKEQQQRQEEEKKRLQKAGIDLSDNNR